MKLFRDREMWHYLKIYLLTFVLTTNMVFVIANTTSGNELDFARDIRPILSNKCFACHGPDQNSRESGLRLDRKSNAFSETDSGLFPIVAGDVSASEIVRRISTHSDEKMPPKDSDLALSDSEIELLTTWIRQGAEWKEHWAFQKPAKRELPGSSDSKWPNNPIDRFVLAKLQSNGMEPSPEANKQTLIRRLTLDLTGLPPTIEEVDAFLTDESKAAYEKIVDRLLSSPHFGEHFATIWLDAARFADTNGYQNDFKRSMWLWRDWVIGALNSNMPFDQFTIEQIAGDLIPNATLDQKIATGFNRNHRTVTEGGSIEEEWHVENLVDRVETTTAVFLGLTVGCARCHDHKFDPISQQEFYQFFAFFNSIDEKGFHNEQRGNVPPLLSVPTQEYQGRLARLESELELATERYNEAKLSLLTDEGKQQETFDAKNTGSSNGQVERDLQNVRAELESLRNSIPTVMIMREREAPRETYVLERGQYDRPIKDQQVEPGFPEVLQVANDSDARMNRMDLARWLVHRDNPLTARVTINRFWNQLFGLGLHETPEDFGVQSPLPTNQALLDWLAVEFMESGWDMKHLLKLIVMSATYRQESFIDREELMKDPGNRWLARGARFRLSAESIRDNALAVSGLLERKIGGRSIKPYQPEGLWDELAGGAGEGAYVMEKDKNLYRRSLYIYRKRTVPHPTMSTFDASNREICQVARQRTNTPMQALALLNDVTYVEAAIHLANRSMQAEVDDRGRLKVAFRLATSREPNSREMDVLANALDKFRKRFSQDSNMAVQFLESGMTKVNSNFPVEELASFASVSSIVLNLDETITRE